MKALAHRLRGRRASRRAGDDADDAERSFRLDDTNQEPAERHHDDKWRRNRGLNSKTGSLSALAKAAHSASDSDDVVPPSFMNSASPPTQTKTKRTASAPTLTRAESPQPPPRLLSRAHSNSRTTSSHPAHLPCSASARPDDRAICASSSSSSGHSSGSRSRSRHGGSMSSNASFLSSHQKPEAAVDVRYSGYLLIKRGLLKVADKRYYFVTRRSPELYSCKDETSFNLWLASGHPLDPHGGDAIARASGLSPVLVGTVLRADGATEEGNGGSHPEKMFSVMIGSASKCITLRFGAECTEKATQWLEALQEVQVTKRNVGRHAASDKKLLLPLNEHNALRAADLEHDGTDVEAMDDGIVLVISEESNGDLATTRPASNSNAKMPRVYAGGKLHSKPHALDDDDATAASTPTSDGSPTSATSEHAELPASASSQLHPPSRIHRMDSLTSCSSTASGQSQGSNSGNVLLFVPVAGSSLTASASRMAKAQQELDALVTKGAKLPSRVMQATANGEAIEWRYGVPEYVLTDLAYVKGRMREPDATPLASYVEECCQTFIMEATHKARYDQWHSVCQETFYLLVNDGERVPGARILENDMLGLLYLGDIEASTGANHGDSDESQDLRAELAEAFPDGFPVEVLDVFTQPPRCYFSWRHWGSFTGKFRGVRGDGSKMEVRGFGEMTVDASRMRSLRLFFKQKDLISGLRQVTDRVSRVRRETATISSLASMTAVAGRTVRAVSAAVAPVTRKGSVPSAKTNEIIEGLANFTIEAKEQHRKQTR
ncbi:hypothetical protein PRNP1_014851 [Phytophthora ramorum]